MKLYKHIIIFLSILICTVSCNDKEETVQYKGEAIFSSEKFQNGDIYIVYGFSFEKGENIPYTLTTTKIPDIIVSNLTDVQNKVTGAVLNSPENEEAFYSNGKGATYNEAKEWFDNYNEVTATDFIALVDSVELYQIWTVQTAAGKFAKILVKDINIITNSRIQDFIEITVDYEYQPDGTRIFRTNRSGT
jgi:hypothetical protein